MSFGRIKCDLSVVSDLNTARMPCPESDADSGPCSCMQRRRGCNGKVEKGDLVSMVNRMVGC